MNYIKIDMIENYIKENNLTRKDFCKKCNMGYESFLKIMRNQSNVNIKAIFKIAKGMELNNVAILFCDKKAKKKSD